MLSGLEKQTRTGCDTHSTARVLVTIVQLCYNAGDFTQLNDRIQDLVKKRSQLKQAVAKMIAECCTFLDNIKDKPTELKLIDTLRTVTAGKIYVNSIIHLIFLSRSRLSTLFRLWRVVHQVSA